MKISKRAFTFVEAAVGAALAASLLVIILGLMTFGQRSGRGSVTSSDFQRMGLYTITHLMDQLLGAREILVPVAGQERACCFQGWDGRFHLYAFDSRRGVLVYRLVDAGLTGVGPEKVLARNVQTAHFSMEEGAALLHIRIVFAKKRADSEFVDSYPLETSIALRN